MENKSLNTKYVFEFADGTTTEMTLSFYHLYMLKNKNKALYDRHNQYMTRMSSQKGVIYDEVETILALYVAYVCAHLNDESIMTEEEFVLKCGSDRMAVGKAFKALLQPKN